MKNNLKRLTQLQGEYDPYAIKMEQARKLSQKWEKTGLLEGLDKEYERNGMSILLENQAKQLIKEATQTGTSVNSEEWSNVALPLVRKVFGEISAKEFVSVQPMNLPSGLVFYINFKYGTATGGRLVSDEIHGTTAGATAPVGGLYGAGQFGYTINEVTTSDTTATTGSNAVSTASIHYDETMISLQSELKYVITETASAGNMDLEGVKAFRVSGSGIEAYYPAYTVPCNNAGTIATPDDATHIRFVVSGSSALAEGLTALVHYHVQPVAYDRGDFEYQGTDINIPEVNLDLNSEPIVAKTRKLKAVWTPEIAQDLNAYHAIDAEAELTSMLSEYIAMEIDLEILSMLMVNADTTEYWSARPGYEWNGSTFVDHHEAYAIPNKTEWYKTLGTKVQKISNQIHAKTMRGGANFMVCGPDVATIIESMPGYNADTDGDKQQFAMGVEKIGALANRWTVYKNPYIKHNSILIGFRGPSFLETGAVFAPYIPLIMTPLIYDPDNFTPRKGVMTRYAKKMVRAEFYGVIHIADLDYV